MMPMHTCPHCNGTGRVRGNIQEHGDQLLTGLNMLGAAFAINNTSGVRRSLNQLMDTYEHTLLRTCNTCGGRGQIPTVLDLDMAVVDTRGSIQNLLHERCGSAVLITGKKDTVRAQHWHRTDWHFCFVISGEIEYREAPLVGQETPDVDGGGRPPGIKPNVAQLATHVLPAGSLFYTPPLRAHAMCFRQDTIFLTLGNRARTPEDHEKDLVRLPEGQRL